VERNDARDALLTQRLDTGGWPVCVGARCENDCGGARGAGGELGRARWQMDCRVAVRGRHEEREVAHADGGYGVSVGDNNANDN
jgi:hypothetical protein